MGISTLSNRTVKLNKSDEVDSKKQKATTTITATTSTTTTKATTIATTMPTVKPQKNTTPVPQKANFEGSMCQCIMYTGMLFPAFPQSGKRNKFQSYYDPLSVTQY